MGYFTEINNSSYRAQGVAEYNRANGNSGHTLLGATLSQYGPSIFMGLAQKIASSSDGKGGSDKDVSVDEQKKTLEKQLNKCLNKIGARDADDINEAVSRAQDEREIKVKAAQAEVDAFTNGTDTYSTQITNLEHKLATGTELTEEQSANNDKINKEINKLKEKRTKALEKAKNNLNQVIENENTKINNIVENATCALNYLEELASLKSIDDSEEITVTEKTEALNEFVTHRNILNSRTDAITTKQKAAKRIQELVNDNPNNKTIQNGYRIIKQQVEDILANRNLNKYQNADTTSNGNDYYKTL